MALTNGEGKTAQARDYAVDRGEGKGVDFGKYSLNVRAYVILEGDAMKNIIIYFSVLLLSLFVGLSSVDAGYDEWLDANKRGDYDTAFKELKPLAEQGGDPDAKFYLGVMYYFGIGTHESYKEAFRWFREAAEQGNESAQSGLGDMLRTGEGIPKNYREAFNWFRKAAEQGNAGAQLNIGLLYLNGQGVPKDYVMAYMWANLAAAHGDELARNLRNKLEKRMTPEQIAEAQRLSREFRVKKP